MKKQILLLLILFTTFSCKESSNSVKSGEKVWVYIEIFYTLKNDTIADFVYGRIDKTDLEKFETDNSSKDLFKLTDGRYIDDNEKIRDVQELNEEGTYYFQFKNVIYVEVVKADPLTFEEKDEEQTE